MGKYTIKQIKIPGHNGDVPNTFYFQNKKTDKLAIVFPGLGYSCHMPLLYYSTLILLNKGFDVLWVEANYGKSKDYMARSKEMQMQWLREDTISAIKSVLIKRNYRHAAMVGKSLGTVSLALLLPEKSLPKDTRNVWLTPLLNDRDINELIEMNPGRKSLFIIGTDDAYYDAKQLKVIKEEAKGKALVIKGADHSLEIGDDAFASLRALQKTLRVIREFV